MEVESNGAIGFGNFLEKNGFQRNKYTKQGWKPTNKTDISSMGNYGYYFIKENAKVFIGLNEKGLPPTMIYPDLKIKGFCVDKYSNSTYDRLFEKYSYKEILVGIIDRQKTFEI